jgi:hypothetical protein
MLGEPVTGATVAGAVLILLGLYISERDNGYSHKVEKKMPQDVELTDKEDPLH